MNKWKIAVLGLVVALGAAQFFQPERTNPVADPQASFESVAKAPPHVAGIVNRACADCHSNRTAWPWYSKVAPVSWLVARDVAEGRSKLNLSQWNMYGDEMSRLRLKAMCQEIRAGEMPPAYYKPMHPASRLTAAEVAAVCSAAGM